MAAILKYVYNFFMHYKEQAVNSLDTIDQDLNKVVLYIEDNASNISLIQNIFKQLLSLTLEIEMSAEAGVKHALQNVPDIILMDIHLPGMSGLDALKILREDNKTSAIPVIALTSAATQHDKEIGALVGFDHYVTKPYDIAELIGIIKNTLTIK